GTRAGAVHNVAWLVAAEFTVGGQPRELLPRRPGRLGVRSEAIDERGEIGGEGGSAHAPGGEPEGQLDDARWSERDGVRAVCLGGWIRLPLGSGRLVPAGHLIEQSLLTQLPAHFGQGVGPSTAPPQC